MLNSIRRYKDLTEGHKKEVFNTIVEIIATHSCCGMYVLREKMKRMSKATEIEFWRRIAEKSRVQ